MIPANSASGDGKLPLEIVRQIDAICDEFELRATEGDLAFAPFVARVDALGRPDLLRELCSIAVDLLQAKGLRDVGQRVTEANPQFSGEIELTLKDLLEAEPTVLLKRTPKDTPPGRTKSTGRKSRGLHIRCPHCSNPIELMADSAYDVVNCDTCGSNFSFIDRSEATQFAATLKKIARFELVARLGVGAFGTVWKARDTDLDRAVAVKIPRRGQLSVKEIELFFREARAAAQLRHPNIVSVHEVGREEDTIFIVSDLIYGVSLSDWLTARRPTFPETAMLMATVAEALDHAHKHGIVHRDLKPSNIMIDNEGAPHVMDFGLAKRESDEIAMTADGAIVGTPAYMSPEQAGGKGHSADRRTDVYSVGVILFELLTGELPFRGNAQMQLHQRMTEDAPNARKLNRHIPRDLATICAKCVEREPGRRYDTAKHVAEELRRWLNKIPIHARPLSLPDRAIRWAMRNPLLTAVAVLVAFLAIAGPLTALQIASQRNRLSENYAEKMHIIDENQKQLSNDKREIDRLREELDVVSGRESPWRLWAENKNPPIQLLMAELRKHSQKSMDNALTDPALTGLDKARMLFAVAIMDRAAGDKEKAAKSFSAVIEVLKPLAAERPNDRAIQAALADAIDDYTEVAELDSSKRNQQLDEATAIRKRLAAGQPGELAPQFAWYEAEMRSALATGEKQGLERYTQGREIQAALASQWPADISGIYRTACLLARRAAPLAASTASDPAAAGAKN